MTTIGDIAQVFDGPHATPKKLNTGPYFLSISSLQKGRLDLTKSAFLSEKDFEKWTKRVTPEEGDLLFSYETRLGEAALMPANIKACLGRRMGLLRFNKNKVIPEYVLYAYLSPAFQQTIKANTVTGATVDRILLNELPNFAIRIPPIEEQEKVANLLGNIDKKIDLNNHISAELEAMAKTLYDYWFVQFDFPGTNGKPYKSSGGKMVYNPLLKREIPEGWKVISLGDYANVKKGTLITEKEANQNGNIKVVSAGQNYSYFHDEANYQENVITISASGASAGFINFWREPIFACDCTTVQGSSNEKTIYILHFLLMRQGFIYQQARGSAQPHVYPKDISVLNIEVPPEALLVKFGTNVLAGNTEITNRLQQNQKLAVLRDWLLPMLMNGQVTIK